MNSWDSDDDDCPNCGLANYQIDDPDYPFCDQRCKARFAERRALRQMRFDLWYWNVIMPLRFKVRYLLSQITGRAR